MTEPKPLLIFRRPFGAWMALVLVATFGGLMSYGAIVMAWMAHDRTWLQVLALLIIVFWIATLHASWKRVSWKGPALVLDADGVTDLWGGKPTIAWTTIARVRLDVGDGDRMVLRLRNHRGLGRAVARLFNGGDFSIYLGSLRVDYGLLQSTADAYIAQAATQVR